MRSLRRDAENKFKKALHETSKENAVQFIGDTHNRFLTNDPLELYKKDNSELETYFNTLKSGVLDLETGDQQVSTRTVNDVLARLYDVSDQIEYKIKATFGKNSLALIEFFPRGKQFIRKANRGDIDTIITNFAGKAKKYEKFLGTDLGAKIAVIATDWAAAIKAQSGEKSDVKDASKLANSALDPIATVLHRLYLKVCLNNEGNEEAAVSIYFDETPLMRKQSSDHDGLGRVFGVVTDTKSGAPIAGVEVRVIDGKNKALWIGKTDKDGKWRTANISVGIFTFHFEKPGYVSTSLAHEILDYEDTQLDVDLAV